MIFSVILILIVAYALPSYSIQLKADFFTRITAISLIYSGVLAFNTFYIQLIGSGIGIYSGLFNVTNASVLFDTVIYLTAAFILISFPRSEESSNYNLSNKRGTTNSEVYSKEINSEVQVSANSSLVFDQSKHSSKLHTGVEQKEGIYKYTREYSIIILFSLLGGSLLVSCSDLISMYLSIELQSFGVYILATLYRDSESATNAGLKYFILGALSSCFILLGAALIYSYSGLTNFESIYTLISVACSATESISTIESVNTFSALSSINIGLILILGGFLFKIAAAPLHNWAPDVYNNVPTLVTTWLTIIPKLPILILLLELQVNCPSFIGSTLSEINLTSINELNNSSWFLGKEQEGYLLMGFFSKLLLISSLLSLLVGTILGLAQTKIKRLLAFSTISHVGFLLLALAINTEQSVDSFIFYLIQYTITNLNTFLIILALGYVIKKSWSSNTISYFSFYKNNESDLSFLSELKGQFFANPLLSIALSICLFSMAGSCVPFI